MSDENDFLSRWSRRKRKVPDEAPLAAEDTAAPEQVVEPETEEEEAALLARLELPVPESMKDGDDFSPFMGKGVPEFLRRRALRVLWRSNPLLANLDGLNDYDDDFTSPELTQKVLATGYQVGRGFVTQVLQETADEEAAEPKQQPTEVTASDTETPAGKAETPPQIEAEHRVEDAPSDETHAQRPRRMRFEV